MDPELAKQLYAGWGLGIQRQSDEAGARIGRQSDGAQLDNRTYNAILTAMMMSANDPVEYASMGTASHVPTAQPWMSPPWVSSAGFGSTLPK